MAVDNISLDKIREDERYNFKYIYESKDIANSHELDSPLENNVCNYYMPEEFCKLGNVSMDTTSAFHLNCRSLSANWEASQNLICDLQHTDQFEFIGIYLGFYIGIARYLIANEKIGYTCQDIMI